MPALVKAPFATTFNFVRAVSAAHRDASGAEVTAAVNAPRFDHDADGAPRGLIVSDNGGPGTADRISTKDGWDGPGPATVLHEYEDAGGLIVRVALYSRSMKATADACLRLAVRHRELKVIPGHLRNRGGHVRHDNRNWMLGGALASEAEPLAQPVLADDAGRVLIDG